MALTCFRSYWYSSCSHVPWAIQLAHINVSWMDATFFSNNKISKCKSGLFEHAQSMSKRPTRLEYIGDFIVYLLYLPDPFSRGLGIDLEGNSTFLPLTLSMHIKRLGLFSHLYRTIFLCITICWGSWIGATALVILYNFNKYGRKIV